MKWKTLKVLMPGIRDSWQKLPLYHSTPLPKAKRVCVAVDDSSCSYNNEDDSSISLEEDFTDGKSSSNSVEGEIAPVIFSAILVNWSSKLPTSVRK